MGILLVSLLRLILFTLLTQSTLARNSTALDQASTNRCYESCKDPFDTFVLCSVPFSPVEDLRVYMNISYYTPTQSECLCQTRGFLRGALDCFYCHDITPIGWEDWCVVSPTSHALSAGIIAAVVTGVLVFSGGVIFAIYWCLVIRKQNSSEKASISEQEGLGMGSRRGSEAGDEPDSREESRRASEVEEIRDPPFMIELESNETPVELPAP